MAAVSYARHQFPPVIIRHAVWLYLRFSLTYRDVEDLLAERGLNVSYETVRRDQLVALDRVACIPLKPLGGRIFKKTMDWACPDLVDTFEVKF